MKDRAEQQKKLDGLRGELRLHRRSECRCKNEQVCDTEIAKYIKEMRIIISWIERHG